MQMYKLKLFTETYWFHMAENENQRHFKVTSTTIHINRVIRQFESEFDTLDRDLKQIVI